MPRPKGSKNKRKMRRPKEATGFWKNQKYVVFARDTKQDFRELKSWVALVDMGAMFDAMNTLTQNGFRVYMYLAYCIKYDEWYLSRQQVMTKMGFSDKTYQRCITELHETGYLVPLEDVEDVRGPIMTKERENCFVFLPRGRRSIKSARGLKYDYEWGQEPDLFEDSAKPDCEPEEPKRGRGRPKVERTEEEKREMRHAAYERKKARKAEAERLEREQAELEWWEREEEEDW